VPGSVIASLVVKLEDQLGPVKLLLEVLDGEREPLWGDHVEDWPYPDDLVIQDRALSLSHDVIKAFIRTPQGNPDTLLDAASEIIPSDVVTFTHSGLGWVEITPPGVDKGTGLAIVAADLGVDPSEVLVFGDMPNDIPMFRWAGYGRVAVENAHPALMALADEVTLSNERDGVAVYLDNMLKQGQRY
jgi:hydroxymethylpyrimidine pyrophosphatase-like HAD family hydrolase